VSLKQLVNNYELLNSFNEYLVERIRLNQISLENATKPEDMYRLQGHIAALRRLLHLRDEINGMDKK